VTTEQIIIAGAGGQGIMLLGKVIAQAALGEGLNVTWFPAYGAEVRGGTANCTVIISSFEIPSPRIDKADTLIIMNEPSLFKFKYRIKDKGLILINSSLAGANIINYKTAGIVQLNLPFTELAAKLGNIRVANMIALGAYITKREIFSKQGVFDAIEAIAPAEKKDLVAINKQAIEEGRRLAG
jgi:2-oxoglutarate ferredoxin oxidoreductase subunit gamma